MDLTKDLTKSQKLLYAIIQRLGTADDKIKLAKLQYFADFIHFAFHDQPISESSNLYEKRTYGPLSVSFNLDLGKLLEAGLLENPKKYYYTPKKTLDLDLSKDEIKTIEYVVNKYGGYPYDVLVDISHKQIPYISSAEGGIVDYTTAYNLVDDYPDYTK